MTTASYSRFFAVVLMGAASMNAANAQVATDATQNPDGIYAVDVSTRQGDCNKAYHWMVSVSDGRVNSIGAMPMAASGQISGSGIVDLAFRRFGQVVMITGRLANGYGSGTWFSSTMQCAGSWRALRQG